MDGKSSNVISAAYETGKCLGRRVVLTGVCLGTCFLSPAPAWAQFGWLNPWKGDSAQTAEQPPADPFAQRRAASEPQFRTAARQMPATSPTSTGGTTAVISDSPATMPNYGAPVPYPTTHAAAVNYAAPAGYPSTGNAANYYSVPPQGNYAPPMAQTQQAVPQVANLPQQQPPMAAAKGNDLFKPARIVAIVNGEPILAGDVLGPVNQMIDEKMASLTPEQRAAVSEEEIDQFKEQALKQMLPGLIDIKVVYLDFMRSVPSDRKEEMQQMLEKNYDEYQLETDLKNAEVTTQAELDMKLREMGGSLAKKKRQFVEKLVAQQQIQRKIKKDEEVTHQQMLDFYEEHSDEYQVSAKAKWEQLMVKFSEFPNRQAAWEATAEMGNQVLRGAPLDAVAKRHSQGIKAANGGQYDWTTKGSLKNETVDQAIFSLPIGQLSPIIESAEGFHIVRVVDRKESGMVPFTEAQVGIKEKIQNGRRQAEMETYLKDVKSKAQVWTIFDEKK